MRRAIMSLRLGIRDFKQARAASLRALLALVLLFPMVAACLTGENPTPSSTNAPTGTAEAVATPTSTPSLEPTPKPTWTPWPTSTMGSPTPIRPHVTSGCTQEDILGNPTPADVGPEPTTVVVDAALIVFHLECGTAPKRDSSDPYFIFDSLLYYSNHFIEWTPDGERLMLNIPQEGETIGTGIYLVSADGSGSRLLVDASPDYNMLAGIHADLSSDGLTLVYSTCRPISAHPDYRDYEIASLNVEDGSLGIVTYTGADLANYPVWSPDGSRIAFLSSRTWDSEKSIRTRLYTREADGSERRVLKTPHLNWLYYASPIPATWSPNGDRIAYVQESYRTWDRRLFTVAADSLDLHGVTAVTTGASWAPDGQRIAFGKTTPQQNPDDPFSTLCMAELDERGHPSLREIIPRDSFQGEVDITHVNWSPDGGEILFMVGKRQREYNDELDRYVYPDLPPVTSVYVVGPDGTGLRRLLEDERPYTVAAWSPDGSRIAIRVDPQLGYVHRGDPRFLYLEQVEPQFEILIVDRDGTVQQVLGREEVIRTR